jgi:hypothetical protein
MTAITANITAEFFGPNPPFVPLRNTPSLAQRQRWQANTAEKFRRLVAPLAGWSGLPVSLVT